MSIFIGFLYLVLQGVGIYSLILAHKLYKTYRFSFIQYFVYFLFFLNSFGFLKICGRFFLGELLAGALGSPDMFFKIDAAVTYVAYPFLVISAYFFYASFRRWMKQPVSRTFKIVYFSIESLILILVFLEIYQFIHVPARTPSFPVMMTVFIASEGIVELLAAVQLLRYSGHQTHLAMGGFVRRMGIYYVTIILIFYIVKIGFWGPFVGIFFYPVVYYSMHLLPLIWMKRFLPTYIIAQPLAGPNENVVVDIFNTYRISEREQEIVMLMLEGMSNAEISETLFISVRTVRNHIYSIYKKMSVKNRLEMTNRLRNVQHVQ